jgi:hypothetical protein
VGPVSIDLGPGRSATDPGSSVQSACVERL